MAEHVTDGVEIWDPTLRVEAVMPLAPRPFSLDGKVLGLLDNSKEKADVFLTTIAERLDERFHVAKVVYRRKPTYSRVVPTSVIAELGESCDVVITAMGA